MSNNDQEARIGWVVDVQHDFMDPDGRLYVKDLEDESDEGARAARPAIEDAVEWMRDHCTVMVYTGDWHSYDDDEIDPEDPDPDEGTYPPHCMGRSGDEEERRGAFIIESVRPSDPVVLEIGAGDDEAREVARTAHRDDRPVFIHKNRFDVFEGNPGTEALVEELARLVDGTPRFYVAGVARDVCVTGAVDGLQERGHRVTALRDATWGLGIEDEDETLARWRAGGEVTTTDELPD